MKFNDLKVAGHRSRNRVGRGIAAGQGKTAGRGTKGQNSRAGSGRLPGFEGGQNPLMQRIPKLRGFRSFKAPTVVVYTGQLAAIKGTVADNFSLFNAGLIDSPYLKVKLVLKGAIDKKVDVKLQSASASAITVLQKAGGSFKAVPQVKRLPKESK